MKLTFIALGLAACLAAGCGAKETYRSGGRTAAYWVLALKQPDVELRRKAAAKIGPLITSDDSCLSAAISALQDDDVMVRLAAIRSVKVYALSKTASVLPELRRVGEKDPEQAVRRAAESAVKEIEKRRS